MGGLDEEEFRRVLARLRVEFEELEVLRSAADGLRVFREKFVCVDTRFD